MSVYYNEFDPFAAEWLRHLIAHGELPMGVVDERPIQEVKAKDLESYTQCHFFTGIGGWPYALKRAGWGKRPIWTGSCPCQPFSSPGRHKGTSDPRHLWPTWYGLIRKCRPNAIIGEQVATKNGRLWLDAVANDLEKRGYAFGACDTDALGLGAPHRRRRNYFAAVALGHSNGRRPLEQPQNARRSNGNASKGGKRLADANLQRLEGAELRQEWVVNVQERSRDSGLGLAAGQGNSGVAWSKNSNTASLWDECDWVETKDGQSQRPVEPGTFPLAYGVSNGVGRLRAYGNAICLAQSQGFIEAFMEVSDGAAR